jgi:hypothetical protein
MCLTPLFREVLTAEKDILVFKILDTFPHGYYSPIYRTDWQKGETKMVPHFTGTTELGTNPVVFTNEMPEWVDRIYQGLHSYRNVPFWANNHYTDIFPMIIPKGTKYIIGAKDDIVSLALRFDAS